MALVSTKTSTIDVEFEADDVPDGDDFDELIDLTDRRRVFIRLVLGLDVDDADALFAPAPSTMSTR